ncbi:MAG: lysophospholipase [Pseudoalteromonas sp.]|nr:lysophospholipase [Pseudoalteromonas sp.]|tara:strand:+ start:2909 stop:3874 length:966 start_codon:yes stop_codon:yes gene_type:complete
MTFYSYSDQLNDNIDTIEQHWQSGTHSQFAGKYGNLFYTIHQPEHVDFAVVLISGRIEASHKYRELIWELNQNNIAVYCCDHIGQGQSARLAADQQLGFIEQFEDFADDLNLFIESIVKPQVSSDYFLLAHSMGGAICCDYVARYPVNAQGAFICAPMLGINTAPFPSKVALWVARSACRLGFSQRYAFGQASYAEKPFSDNELTNSPERYAHFRALYANQTHLQLGGVSFAWLQAALNWTFLLPELLSPTPIHIALAEQDSIVDNLATKKWAQKQSHISISEFPMAKHELLNEIDSIRHPLMQQFYEFCDSHRSFKATGS